MTNLLNLDRYPEAPVPEPSPAAPGVAQEPVEFEIVVGRRQIAGAALVAIVLLAVFSGISYLIGKSMQPVAAATVQAPPALPTPVVPPVVPAPAPASAPAVEAPEPETGSSAADPAPVDAAVATPPTTTAPLFGVSEAGKVYLQVGVIQQGLAAIWAEGLRTHGLDAFAAPGPNDGLHLWRVVVGRAKDTLEKIGVPTFGRRYEPKVIEAASPPDH